MALVGYARVSTTGQTVEQQVDALRAAGCRRIFRDEGVRATAAKRPGLIAARRTLKAGDVFVVWAIDRAFRSTMEAIVFLDELMREGVTFQSLTQSIDTRTPEGRKWYIDTASWAEYERAVISRRTKEAMAAAKRRGRRFGRPRKLTKAKVSRARAAITGGRTVSEVARQADVSPRTLLRALAVTPKLEA